MLDRFARSVPVLGALLIAEHSFGEVVDVAPSRITVVYGRVMAGSASSLSTPDGDPLTVCRFTVPNGSVAPITFRIEAQAPANTGLSTFRLTSRQSALGVFNQSLNLFDWSRNVFDPYTNVTNGLSDTYAEAVCNSVGDPAKYVRASDRKMMALVRVRPLGPTLFLGWSADFDCASFQVQTMP